MPALSRYAGFDGGFEPEPIEPGPSEAERALRAAEAEIDRLKGVVRHQEAAQRVAGKVLLPYLNSSGRG